MDNIFERIGKLVPQAHVALYRGTGGIVGGWMLAPVLLLSTTGRKSGKQRTTPLTFMPHGGDFVVIASLGGAPHHPAWWLNLMANSQAQVELGIRVFVANPDCPDALLRLREITWASSLMKQVEERVEL